MLHSLDQFETGFKNEPGTVVLVTEAVCRITHALNIKAGIYLTNLVS
jgi:hypothetical protein